MSDDTIKSRGASADALLENALFREVIAGLEQHYTDAWRAARTVEAREDCHRYVTLVDKLVGDIRTISTSGKFAAQRIKELEGKRVIAWPKL